MSTRPYNLLEKRDDYTQARYDLDHELAYQERHLRELRTCYDAMAPYFPVCSDDDLHSLATRAAAFMAAEKTLHRTKLRIDHHQTAVNDLQHINDVPSHVILAMERALAEEEQTALAMQADPKYDKGPQVNLTYQTERGDIITSNSFHVAFRSSADPQRYWLINTIHPEAYLAFQDEADGDYCTISPARVHKRPRPWEAYH
jgi:hypothetical protein